MRQELWQANGSFRKGVVAAKANVQSVVLGSGREVHDEYSIVVTQMPPNLTPEAFLEEMASDLNGAINDAGFNAVNRFSRKQAGRPEVGELVEIDILGPDNGAVLLAEKVSDYFIYQTVTTPALGTHPEYGSREFGFEQLSGGSVRFYTRGVSRAGDGAVKAAGTVPQKTGWTRLMKGISDAIEARGGKVNAGSFQVYKTEAGPNYDVAPYFWPGRP
ncbi:MAG: hypothetical protein ACRENP_17960 [Longimicrobiales bacterium]